MCVSSFRFSGALFEYGHLCVGPDEDARFGWGWRLAFRLEFTLRMTRHPGVPIQNEYLTASRTAHGRREKSTSRPSCQHGDPVRSVRARRSTRAPWGRPAQATASSGAAPAAHVFWWFLNFFGPLGPLPLTFSM